MSRLSVLMLVTIVSSGVGNRVHAENKKSSAEDFKQFGSMLIGRWKGDVAVLFDNPGGTEKQGDVIPRYDTFKWIADGHAVEWEFVSGSLTGKTFIFYDAANQYIRAANVGSDGGYWQSMIWKKNARQWGWKLTAGGLPSGQKVTGEGDWIFKEGSKTLNIQGTAVVDAEQLKTDQVYTRVNK